jgi:hypothetical protein
MRFTYEDFRRTDELRIEWGRFINSDIGKIVLRVMREKYRPEDVPSNVDALASARVLSQFHGAHSCLDDLERLAMPLAADIPIDAGYQAAESDHERMPSEIETRGVIRP